MIFRNSRLIIPHADLCSTFPPYATYLAAAASVIYKVFVSSGCTRSIAPLRIGNWYLFRPTNKNIAPQAKHTS